MSDLRPFIIDCDTGRDDALTLWLAVKARWPLCGVICSYGNTVLANVADNTARVLSLVGYDNVPLLAGLEQPQQTHVLFQPVVKARQQVSGNGLCNLDFPPSARGTIAPSTVAEMARVLKDLAAQHGGALDYFITGPASNFAAIAQELGASLKETVARITMLGGKFDPLWSEIPGADFNIASDPHALDQIMRLGLPMRFVPLNATWPIYLTLQQIEALRPTNDLARWAQDLMAAHCRYFAPEPVFRFHDPSVLLAARLPEKFKDRRLHLNCDEKSADFGRLTETVDGIPCQVYETDQETQSDFRKSILHWMGFDGY